MGHWKIGVKILCGHNKGSEFFRSLKNKYVAKAGRVKILWKLKYGGQNSIFFSWNPWSKFYVPWKRGSKFYIFSQCLEKGGSKPRSLPTNFTEGVPPPGSEILWHWVESNFARTAQDINQWNVFDMSKLWPIISPRVFELMTSLLKDSVFLVRSSYIIPPTGVA